MTAEEIKALPKNWDSYGADPIDPALVDRAAQFLARCHMVPSGDGSMNLEWHTHGVHLSVEFTPDGETLVYAIAEDATGQVGEPVMLTAKTL